MTRTVQTVDAAATPVAAAPCGAGVAVADAAGAVHLFTADDPPRRVVAHDGAVLSLAADPASGGVLSGGDDGGVVLTGADGSSEPLAALGAAWIDSVAAAGGARAASAGRVVHVWREGAARPDALDHGSTAAGLAFDARGRRLAVAHYGGVTLWEQARRGWKASRLIWHGSHRGVTFSPDGRFAVTTMQEPALHGWRLRDKADMRMSGYPARVKAMAWVADGAHLATSGADCAVCWPFDGPKGPMGRAPMLVAQREGRRCTAVAALPGAPWVLAGFDDGAVVVAELVDGAPGRVVAPPGAAAIVALAMDAEARFVVSAAADGRLSQHGLR